MAEEDKSVDALPVESEISPRDAAYALGVSSRTVTNMINDGLLTPNEDFAGRRWIPVGELLRLAERRGLVGKPADIRMRDRLRRDILPKYGHPHKDRALMVSVG